MPPASPSALLPSSCLHCGVKDGAWVFWQDALTGVRKPGDSIAYTCKACGQVTRVEWYFGELPRK